MEKEFRRTALFGLNKKSVDLFLRRLHYLQEIELQNLRNKVNEASSVNQRLQGELQDVRGVQRKEKVKEIVIQTVNKTEEPGAQESPVAPGANRPSLKLVSPVPKNKEFVQEELQEKSERSDPETPEVFEAEAISETAAEETKELAETETPIPIELSAPAAEELASTPVSSFRDAGDFWGEIGHYLDTEPAAAPFYATDREELPSLFSRPPKSDSRSEEIAAAYAETTATEEPEPLEEPLPERSEDPEIENIKRHYIVGKIAGETITDRQGKVIVAKSAVISEETIRKAQREGKLAELIVNMKPSGSGN